MKIRLIADALGTDAAGNEITHPAGTEIDHPLAFIHVERGIAEPVDAEALAAYEDFQKRQPKRSPEQKELAKSLRNTQRAAAPKDKEATKDLS